MALPTFKIIIAGTLYVMAKLGLASQYDDMIIRFATEHGHEPALIKALIRTESRFNPMAHAKTDYEDSRGLGQINANVARSLGISNLNELFIPEVNIATMCRLLTDIKRRYKSLPDIIAAYNAGSVKTNERDEYINAGYVREVHARYLLYRAFTW